MPFTEFQTLGEFLIRFGISEVQAALLPSVSCEPSARLSSHLGLVSQYLRARSEAARCEFLIAPLLLEGLEPHLPDLTLLSHESFGVEEPLRGVPDYLVGKRSPLSPEIVVEPYLVVVEAKRDDFDSGWGQCAAAMLTAQRLNGRADLPVWGIATTGRIWEVGRLTGTVLTRNRRFLQLDRLEELVGSLRYIFGQCAEAARQFQPAAAA